MKIVLYNYGLYSWLPLLYNAGLTDRSFRVLDDSF